MYTSDLLTAAAAVGETSVVRSAVHVLRGLCLPAVSEAHVLSSVFVKSMCCTCEPEHREVRGGSCTVFCMPWHCMCVDASTTVDLLSQRAAIAVPAAVVAAAAAAAAVVCDFNASSL